MGPAGLAQVFVDMILLYDRSRELTGARDGWVEVYT